MVYGGLPLDLPLNVLGCDGYGSHAVAPECAVLTVPTSQKREAVRMPIILQQKASGPEPNRDRSQKQRRTHVAQIVQPDVGEVCVYKYRLGITTLDISHR
jgi:hypothetical protein